jgi:hypothetical protein
MNRFTKITLGLSAAALAIGGVACAQTPATPSPAPERGPERTETRAEAQARTEEMFVRLDVNKDGKLDRADREARRQQMREAMFDRLDTNKDGSISKAEFLADRGPEGDRGPRPDGERMRDMPPPPGAPDMAAPGVAGPESDGPARDHPERRRGHGDRHGGRHGMKGPMMGFGKADADGDRSITRAEFVAAALQRFDGMDGNKDGKVTPEERRAAHERMRAEWKGRTGDRRQDSPPPAPPAAPAPK